MSKIDGKWMYNYSDDGIWSNSDYYDIKEDAIKNGNEEFVGEYDRFYVGQIKSARNDVHVFADRILENISEDMYEEVGEVAEDYLRDVKQEHEDILNERLNKVVMEWMKEFNYEPSFFKIANVEKVDLNKN